MAVKDNNKNKKNFSYEKPGFNDPKRQKSSLDKPSFVHEEPPAQPKVKPKK
ncbi:hypothetical protein [Sporosarcina aquimarina]|uniref:Glycogen biosynthesis protein GlgD n=1 Tax=Sporosarcina aquimarina TaxID=114975 RepID=A0ABU4G3H5_9BACL|nr:hypothetical protein [Sporosarcina aquimarina]MDW0111525.1 hypothetical protein [Sporosarcina aquimarina]